MASLLACGGAGGNKTSGAAPSAPPTPAPAAGQPAESVPAAAVSAPDSAAKNPLTAAEQKAQAEAAAKAKADNEAALKVQTEKATAEKAAAQAKADEQKAAKTQAAASAAAKAEAARVAQLDVPAPSIATSPGIFASAVTVTVKGPALKEAVVSYTLDGSDPTPSKGTRYTAPISVSTSSLVKVIAYIPGGKKSSVVSAEFTIGEVCAAPGGSGDGRRNAPLGSIRAALDKAKSMDIGTIKLAAGTIEESVAIDAPIIMIGGFRSDFSAASGGRTVLRGKAAGPSSKKSPAFALKVSGTAVDSKTRIERVEFRGPDASYGAGILVADGASPEFVDCASFGGSGSYGYGAVSVASASPSFRSCRLSGGGGATSYGLSLDGASAKVEASILSAGSGSVGGYGLVATDAKAAVSSSVLAAGTANVGYGAAFYNSKGSRLERCTIVGGTGKDVSGIFISASDPAIEKCVISASGSGKSYGITANYGDSSPSLLSGTVFLGSAGGLYYDAQTKTAYPAFNASGRLSSADGKTPSRPQGEGNSIGKFELGAAPAYATPAGSGVDAGAPALTSR